MDTAEVDFIATKTDEKLYIQVTESRVSEDVRGCWDNTICILVTLAKAAASTLYDTAALYITG